MFGQQFLKAGVLITQLRQFFCRILGFCPTYGF